MTKPLQEYKVTGSRMFRGHAPGETFKANLAPSQERRAIQRGDIRKVNKKD